MALVWDALYLGKPTNPNGSTLYLDDDNGYGDRVTERAGQIVGETYGSSSAPLSQRVVEITPEDTNGNGVLETDYYSAVEYLNYDIGDGPQREIFDTIVVYDVTLTFRDGTTGQITGVVIQDFSGNMFLAPEYTNNADHQLMQSKAIESITIGNVITDRNANLVVDRMPGAYVCFAAGTRIATATGLRTIESLRVGDLVQTRDHGLQPLRWIGISTVYPDPADARRRPVTIRAGALAAGVPGRDLTVSPNHRVLLRSAIVSRMTGADEVLVAAKFLTDIDGIDALTTPAITYVHVLFDRHEVLDSEGAWSESFFPGPQAMKMVSPRNRLALQRLLPALVSAPDQPALAPARPFVDGARARQMAARHARNGKPLQEPDTSRHRAQGPASALRDLTGR